MGLAKNNLRQQTYTQPVWVQLLLVPIWQQDGHPAKIAAV